MLMQGIPGVCDTPVAPEEEFPRVSTELVEALEARFPDRCPSWLTIPDREFGAYYGRIDVVRFLRQVHDRASVMTKEQP